MADIHVLPGCEPLALEVLPADRALSSAMDARLVDVIIIGIDHHGRTHCWATNPDKHHIIGLLAEGGAYFMSVQAVANDPPEPA